MKWHKNLYVSKTLKRKKLFYEYRIRYAKGPTGTYCILPAVKEGDLFEICHSELLRYPQFYPEDQIVLGIAASRREAFELVGEMLLQTMDTDGCIHPEKLL